MIQAQLAIVRGLLTLELYIMEGAFYPQTIDNSARLKYYSPVFDYIEIDFSFYRIPVNNWARRTPKD
jgi:uncharacterized protein YecE (DUF72 family)